MYGISKKDLLLIASTLSFLERKLVNTAIENADSYHWPSPAKADRPYALGQMMLERGANTLAPDIMHGGLREEIEKNHSDQVFLSILAHPGGDEVAFKLFDTFCDLVPAERMAEILALPSARIRKFCELFEQEEAISATYYANVLKKRLSNGVPVILPGVPLPATDIEPLKRINRLLVDGKTPWTLEGQNGYYVELFELFDRIKHKDQWLNYPNLEKNELSDEMLHEWQNIIGANKNSRISSLKHAIAKYLRCPADIVAIALLDANDYHQNLKAMHRTQRVTLR